MAGTVTTTVTGAEVPRLSPLHWGAAWLVALALHLGVLWAYSMAPDDGAEAPGLGGISVALSLAATQAGAEQSASDREALAPAEPADVTEVTEVAPMETPTVAPPEPPAVTPAPPAPVTPPTPEVPVVETRAAAPLPAETAPPPATEATPAPEPMPTPPPRPARATPQTAAEAPPARRQAASPAQETAPPADRRQEASRAATATQGRADNGRIGQSADERDAMGGGPAGNPAPDYMNRLRYRLERNKTYPKKARRLRQQGIVHLYFRVTRDGRVLRHEIRKSPGHPLLDAETDAMLERAQPLAPPPDGMKGGYLDVVVPVVFSLRGNN